MHDSKREPYGKEMERHELTPVPEMKFGPTVSPDITNEAIISQVAHNLNASFEAHAFDCLIVAAPPEILAALTLQLAPAVRTSIAADIDKNFTEDKSRALLDHLKKTLAVAHIK